MALINHLLQGLNENISHLSEITNILKIKEMKNLFLSVAYVRERGVELIEDLLIPYKKNIKFYIGIRNGVTSVQALKRLIKNGIKLTLVDTASTSTIFHPKILMAYSDDNAKIIMGSANLTYGGLIRNIEASTLLDLNLKKTEDKKYFDDLIYNFTILENKHPKNIFEVKKNKDVDKLLEEGRVSDEYKVAIPVIYGNSKKDKNFNDIKEINLSTRQIKSRIIRPRTPRIKKSKTSFKTSHNQKSEWNLLWESKPLTERDLNIPTGRKTNPTGSMLFKKGNSENIEQRSYFRKVVFNDLKWRRDEVLSKSHLERVNASFQIIVKGINYGVFYLTMTHNTKTDTKSYKQHNAMTQLHWGDAKEIIKKRHLLGCTLRLYKPLKQEDSYIIDIE